MNIIPAIDLYDGQCVRLYQGQFAQTKRYSKDPAATAQHYAAQGATNLHIVDLNGAKIGRLSQLKTILAIKQTTNLTLQIGGGLRDPDIIAEVFACGIDKVVIGSLAVRDINATKALINLYGNHRIILAFDVIIQTKPMVKINGWQSDADQTLWTLLDSYSQFNNLEILCTDISRDGTLTSPNFALYQQCVERFPQLKFQASGGVKQMEDLTKLKSIGVAAVVVGKALYENCFTIEDILNLSLQELIVK